MNVEFIRSSRRNQPEDFLTGVIYTSAEILRVLWKCNMTSTTKLNIQTAGLTLASVHPSANMSFQRATGLSSALGICKCLVYEMPLLTNSHIELDPLEAVNTITKSKVVMPPSVTNDVYGVTCRAKLASRPQMQYYKEGKMFSKGVLAYSSGAYIFTGDLHVNKKIFCMDQMCHIFTRWANVPCSLVNCYKYYVN